jgi:hypothetical protein
MEDRRRTAMIFKQSLYFSEYSVRSSGLWIIQSRRQPGHLRYSVLLAVLIAKIRMQIRNLHGVSDHDPGFIPEYGL